MIMSVSTLIIFSGAATPSRVVNFSIVLSRAFRLMGRFNGALAGAGQPCAACIRCVLLAGPLA
jgi:hypothetical protein